VSFQRLRNLATTDAHDDEQRDEQRDEADATLARRASAET
jgi:hypothetical protein